MAVDEWLRMVADQMPGVMWTVDNKLCFTASLGEGLKSLGLKPQEIVGVDLYEFFETEDKDFPSIAMHIRALAGESCCYTQEWAGRVFDTQLRPLLDDDGEVVGCIGVAHDVTLRERKQESLEIEQQATDGEREKFRNLSKRLPAMLYQTAGDSVMNTFEVPFVNAAVAKFLGYTPDEIYENPQRMLEAIYPEDRQRYFDLAFAAMDNQTDFQIEMRIVNRNGDICWMHCCSSPQMTGETAMIFHGVAVDITESKQREQKLRDEIELVTADKERIHRYSENWQSELMEVKQQLVVQKKQREEADQSLDVLRAWLDEQLAENAKQSDEAAIGLDNHLLQPLFAVQSHLESSAAGDQLDECIQLVQEVLKQGRGMLNAPKPALEAHCNLVDALDGALVELKEARRWSIEFQAADVVVESSLHRATILRLVKQALECPRLSWSGRNMVVRLEELKGNGVLQIEDAAGVAPNGSAQPTLQSLQSLASIVDGKTTFEKRNGGGAVLKLVWDLHQDRPTISS